MQYTTVNHMFHTMSLFICSGDIGRLPYAILTWVVRCPTQRRPILVSWSTCRAQQPQRTSWSRLRRQPGDLHGHESPCSLRRASTECADVAHPSHIISVHLFNRNPVQEYTKPDRNKNKTKDCNKITVELSWVISVISAIWNTTIMPYRPLKGNLFIR